MSFLSSFRKLRTTPSQRSNRMLAEKQLQPTPTKPLSNASISVIIPLYNHARYIKAALESVLAQTSAVNEIILIDDGSSDNGFSIAQEVLAKTPNAILLQQENADAYNAMNRAISISQGDYLAVLNSDDMFTPEKIERCRGILARQPEIGMITGDIRFVDSNGKAYRRMNNWMQQAHLFLEKTGLPQLSQINRNFAFTTSNMVFSRKLWEASGGFQKLRYCHDFDFLMFAYSNGKVFTDLGHDHVIYRRHKSNTVKENATKVDIEVAAIIAHTLKTYGPKLFSSILGEADLAAFRQALRRRNMSDLILFFITISQNFKTRAQLYEYATDPSRLTMLRNALR